MASMEEIITQLKGLRPEQVDEVATMVSRLAKAESSEGGPSRPAPQVVDEAVQHGWPAVLFTELIGSLPELERAAQPPVDNRANL